MAAACSTNNTAVSPEVAAVNQDDEYHLGTGDLLRINVFGHEDLSGEFEIDSAGRITLPLVGDFLVVDRSLDDVEQMIVSALEPEHLKNPQVSVEVIEYQNCYFIGEVAVDPAWLADAPPRSCRCAPGMRVIDLFKKCGWIYRGFTYRASGDVVIMRDGKAIRGGPETLVMPGDVIELQERFF